MKSLLVLSLAVVLLAPPMSFGKSKGSKSSSGHSRGHSGKHKKSA